MLAVAASILTRTPAGVSEHCRGDPGDPVRHLGPYQGCLCKLLLFGKAGASREPICARSRIVVYLFLLANSCAGVQFAIPGVADGWKAELVCCEVDIGYAPFYLKPIEPVAEAIDIGAGEFSADEFVGYHGDGSAGRTRPCACKYTCTYTGMITCTTCKGLLVPVV